MLTNSEKDKDQLSHGWRNKDKTDKTLWGLNRERNLFLLEKIHKYPKNLLQQLKGALTATMKAIEATLS